LKYSYETIIEQDASGQYVASVPCIEACYAQGSTPDEAAKNLADVLEMRLRDIIEDGGSPPVQCRFVMRAIVEADV
jgi:predicted RNase H-like HicB family nuclease